MLRRHFITGEWEEVEDSGKREVIVYEGHEETKNCSAICAKKPWRSTSLAVHPLQVEAFNRAAQKARTGAYYTKDGALVAESRGARNRELARRGQGDGDAGYGDRPPGG
jgi:hypothetical protein